MAEKMLVCNLILIFCFASIRSVINCPTKCRCTGTAIFCMYKDITTDELKTMAPFIPNNTTKLYLNGNQITTFPTKYFKNLKQLEYLALSYNQIDKLPENLSKYFPFLQILYLATNKIKSITPRELVSLARIKVLNLDNNSVETIPDFSFSKMEDLSELLLAQNHLKVITGKTFHGLKNLVKLQISNNGLETLDTNSFKGIPNVEEISLHSNNIQVLPTRIFSGLQNLRTLHLYNNKLEEIEANIFKGLQLDEVFLNSNYIRTIPARLFDHAIIGRVFLHDNKLTCDCKLAMSISLYLGTLIKSGKLILGKCYSPRKFKRRPVKDITPSDLNCTVCHLSPCEAGYKCSINTTSKNHTCKPLIGQIMVDNTEEAEEISSDEKPNYVIYAVITICILCIFGIILVTYFIISKRRKRKAFEVSTIEDDNYIYEKVNPERDPELTGLTSKRSFKIVQTPAVINPQYV